LAVHFNQLLGEDAYQWYNCLPIDDETWLNDSEAEMQAEDARWEATYARHPDQFAALAAAARAEIARGTTQPMFEGHL